MTGMRRWRRAAKSLIVLSFVWEAVAIIAGLGFLLFVVVPAGISPPVDRVMALVESLGIFAIALAAIWAARRQLRRGRPAAMAIAEGDH